MRGPDTFNENLFTQRKVEDFVPEGHPLRPILQMVTAALAKMGWLLDIAAMAAMVVRDIWGNPVLDFRLRSFYAASREYSLAK